ncbi:MAG: BatD family protein [Parachlamydiaceae bacterium]|nr:BatD family protein [Parachlamydiaceae bacterium]
MVNKILAYVFILLMPLSLQADFANSDNFVTANIDENNSYANQPLSGTFTVTHDQNNAVDTSSFVLGTNSIKVEFVQNVKISSNSPIVISYYKFQMPAKPAGLYMLPEASVKIAGKQYRSIMSSYEVKGESNNGANSNSVSPAPSFAPSSSSNSAPKPASPTDPSMPPSKIILKLEADTGVKKALYPRQKTKFTYRYFYNTNISLVTEQLPLLDAEGFLKFGDKEVKDSTENNMSVREISQMVEAIKPGTFTFGPSIIEGYAYTENGSGKPVYSSSKLVSEVPAITLTVKTFPEEGKPPSFNGSIGEFDFRTTLSSSPDIFIGDEISLNVDISGKSDVKDVFLPEISKQPGFSGFFRMSDLPPVGTVKGDTKNFVVSMRPTAEVKEIPSIEFSFFNPETEQFTVLNSKPIPINVISAMEKPKTPLKEEKSPKKESTSNKENPLSPVKPSESTENLKNSVPPNSSVNQVAKNYLPNPIEIQANYSLQTADLYNKIFGSWLVLGMIPFGLALLFYQITLRDYLDRIRNQINPETSQDLYTEFLKQNKGSSRYYELLNRSLKLKLVELGEINELGISTESLAGTGASGEVRAFLNDVEEKRFSRDGKLNPVALEATAQTLIEHLNQIGKQL